MPLVTKLGVTGVTYHKDFSRFITIISLLPQRLLTCSNSRGLTRSFDKLRKLSLYRRSTCGHQKLLSGATQWLELPLIKPDNLSMTWSCEIIWLTTTITSPLLQCMLPLNLTRWWFAITGPHPQGQRTVWLRGLPRSRNKA